jgi:hypothetical protein
LNTALLNEYTYFGAQWTVHDFESPTDLLEIHLAQKIKVLSNSHNCAKWSEVSTSILSRNFIRRVHLFLNFQSNVRCIFTRHGI